VPYRAMGRSRGPRELPRSRGRTAPSAVFKANCAFKAPRCFGGHELRITICRVGAKVCNSCMRQILCTYTHRCDNCDYDLCRKCFSDEGKELGADNESSLIRPPLGDSYIEDASVTGSTSAFQTSHEVQLRLYEEYRRAQGISDERLREETARLQEELRLQNELRMASEMIEEQSTVMPTDPELPAQAHEGSLAEMPSAMEQFSFETGFSMPSWCEPPVPWRTSRQPRPLTEHRKRQIRLVYGECGRRPAPTYVHQMAQTSSGSPCVVAGGAFLPAMPVSAGTEPNATFMDEPALPLHPVASVSAAWRFAGDIHGAGSLSARRSSPRTPMGIARQARGSRDVDIRRPCVDDLHGGFGRAQWEFG